MVTESEPIDETIPYNVVCRDLKFADKRDSAGNRYLTGMKFEVTEPEEWKGETIMCNYLPIADAPSEESRKGWRDFERTNEQFMRFLQSFKVECANGEFDERDCIGLSGVVTAVNEKYQGRNMIRVQDFLL